MTKLIIVIGVVSLAALLILYIVVKIIKSAIIDAAEEARKRITRKMEEEHVLGFPSKLDAIKKFGKKIGIWPKPSYIKKYRDKNGNEIWECKIDNSDDYDDY